MGFYGRSMSQPRPPLTNRHIALALLSLVVFMVGLSFLAVPLYGLFCKMTGYGGTPQIGATALPTKIYDRTITVSFITDTDTTLPWSFQAEQQKIDVKVGQTALVSFSAHNDTARLTAGAAVYNVTPDKIGKYFHKTQCFCFQEQILNPNATAHFPVMFYIDPAIMDDKSVRDVSDITLAYTFYPANSARLDQALDDFYAGKSLPLR
jgi:cytochrome c oxidase assembly protein subunit 11